MKTYSWNVRYNNPDFERVEKFIKDLDFDIFALQEVPDSMLIWLKTLPYSIASSTDWINEQGVFHLVILSKFPIVEEKKIELPQELYTNAGSWISRLFKRMMRWDGWFNSRTMLMAKVALPTGECAVFSIHLHLLYGTEVRQKELAILERESSLYMDKILCGDFNILSWHTALLNVLVGGTLRQFLWWKERVLFNGFFSRLQLKNPLAKKVTHYLSLSQLDHILVSSSLPIVKSNVLKKTYGSDHCPIFVEVGQSTPK